MRYLAIAVAFVAVIALSNYTGRVHAGPPASTPVSPFSPNNSIYCAGGASCESALTRQFEYYWDMPFKLLDRDREAKKWTREVAMKAAVDLVQKMSVPCDVVDAQRAGGGKVPVDGRKVEVNVFEAACRSGTGYFLVSQKPRQPLAISCFAAEAARGADVAKGATPDGFTCALSDHADTKLMAGSVLKQAGTACNVREYHWIGVSYTTGTEFSEVACDDGHGYVLELPATSAAGSLAIVGCQDAVKDGVLCSLTHVTKPVTLQTLRDAIKAHPVSCEPTQIKYMGRETEGRRYVVELLCPDQPNGLVAFIPLGDNAKPFETVDCPTATQRAAVQCTLTTKQ